eukprot:TRINITY_DN3747_c1_g2_i1.p1 TRINITY_DN3747_c1_g2~~TRINITY_DN3747_c1_g2_i1.p1  ORF type:complete len:104 (+),score=5.67 TRINITY_DN3747_c1_g2_i1:22-333(+)
MVPASPEPTSPRASVQEMSQDDGEGDTGVGFDYYVGTQGSMDGKCLGLSPSLSFSSLRWVICSSHHILTLVLSSQIQEEGIVNPTRSALVRHLVSGVPRIPHA